MLSLIEIFMIYEKSFGVDQTKCGMKMGGGAKELAGPSRTMPAQASAHSARKYTVDDFFEENTIDRTDKYEQVWPHSAAGEIHLIKSEQRSVSFSYMGRAGWSKNKFFLSLF